MSAPPPVDRLKDARRRLLDIAWLPPLIAAVLGCGLALLIDAGEGPPQPTSIAISVDRARDSLWGGLALLFTSLSVVMAVVAMSAQNMASRFSPRLLRIRLRALSNRVVLVTFAFTASYIVTELILNRRRLPDDPARPLGLGVGTVLLVVSSVILVGYINRLVKWIRVDLTVRWVGRLILRTGRKLADVHRDDDELPDAALEAPPDAVGLTATRSGYLVDIDTAQLHRLAVAHEVVIAAIADLGQIVTPGDRLGWINGSTDDETLAASAALSFDLADGEDPDVDIEFDVRLLVDISLMALSPGVNDPHTAEQCIDQLTLVLHELAECRPGPRGRRGPDGQTTVLVNRPTLGSLVEGFTERVLLYGADDPVVTGALLRLAQQLERVGPLDGDRRTARALSDDIKGAASPVDH